MTIYNFVKAMGFGVVCVKSSFGEDMLTERKLRKDTKCETCGEPLAKGTRAFGPIGNGMNRMHRVHGKCVRDP